MLSIKLKICRLVKKTAFTDIKVRKSQWRESLMSPLNYEEGRKDRNEAVGMVEIITWCVLAVAMEAGWDYQVVCVRLRLYRASQTKQQVQRCNGELSKHRSFTKIIPDSGSGTRNERKKKQLGYDDAGTKHETLVKPRCTLFFCLFTHCVHKLWNTICFSVFFGDVIFIAFILTKLQRLFFWY